MTLARFETKPASSPRTSTIGLFVSAWGRLSFEACGILSLMCDSEHAYWAANQAASVDAPIASLLDIEGRWRRTTEQGGYANPSPYEDLLVIAADTGAF